MEARSFANLAPTLIVSADMCPLRASNDRLAQMLADAQVHVQKLCPEHTPHGFLTLPHFAADTDTVEKTWDQIAEIVKLSLLESTPNTSGLDCSSDAPAEPVVTRFD